MPPPADSSSHPIDAPVALVGAGALATVLGRRLHQCGIPIAAVLSRRDAPARALARRVEAPVGSSDGNALPASARSVFLCVPDDAIDAVARMLASVSHAWSQTVVAHTSGALSAAVLAPVAHHGAQTMSFHPVQTLTPETPPGALDGVVVGVEGDTEAVAYGTRLAERIGATPIRLSADEKVRYHAAAVLASNGLVALAGVAQDVLATAGIAPDVAQRLLRPLFAQTADNVGQADPAHVLTGPVVRGDCGTVSEHRKALEANIPRVRPLYDRLSEEMVRLAEQNGRLPPEAAAALRRLWCSKPDT